MWQMRRERWGAGELPEASLQILLFLGLGLTVLGVQESGSSGA